jgi:carotenoid cleavage dioxygenase-like enzyme
MATTNEPSDNRNCQEERVSPMPTLTDVNPWLQGRFAPVRQERVDGGLEVTGSISPELNGLRLRNGGEFRFSLWRRP